MIKTIISNLSPRWLVRSRLEEGPCSHQTNQLPPWVKVAGQMKSFVIDKKTNCEYSFYCKCDYYCNRAADDIYLRLALGMCLKTNSFPKSVTQSYGTPNLADAVVAEIGTNGLHCRRCQRRSKSIHSGRSDYPLSLRLRTGKYETTQLKCRGRVLRWKLTESCNYRRVLPC